jgi:hypothetical protein
MVALGLRSEPLDSIELFWNGMRLQPAGRRNEEPEVSTNGFQGFVLLGEKGDTG